MKKLLLSLGLLLGLTVSAAAQNPQCPNRPLGDSTNACANTRFVEDAIAAAVPALPSGDIFVGNNSNEAQARTMSGSCTISNTGVITCTQPTIPIGPPQGRLTLTSNTCVPTASVNAATTLYYTPCGGRYVPIWNGSSFVMTDVGGQLSQATTDATKSPAAVGASQAYDIFVWSDGGTYRATRGAARSLSIAAEITYVQGIPTNTSTITNGPAAGFGTYVGTVASNSGSTLDFSFGGQASGGTAALLNVWNAFNRVPFTARIQDSTPANWTYSSATIRAVNNSTANRGTFTMGLATEPVAAMYMVGTQIAAVSGSFCVIGFALDATNVTDRRTGLQSRSASTTLFWPSITGTYAPQVGQHFIQAVEGADGTNNCTFFNSGSVPQGLEITVYM